MKPKLDREITLLDILRHAINATDDAAQKVKAGHPDPHSDIEEAMFWLQCALVKYE